jgi:hypothetical protein
VAECFGARIATKTGEPVRLNTGEKRSGEIMNPTAKPLKKSKKIEPAKKLERKTPLMSVRSLTVKW